MNGRFYYYSGLYENLDIIEAEEINYVINIEKDIEYFEKLFPYFKYNYGFCQDVGLIITIRK